MLSKILQIKKEEQKPVFLLILYGFFMGASIAFFYTASISLFLHNFQRDMLPYNYIAGGLVLYLFGKGFRRYQKTLSISGILIYGIIFLLITSGIIIIGYILTSSSWIAFLMFLWINVFLFIHTVGFNGMASRLFNLQQGKRLYAVIGVGEVISNVLGFFSVPFILRVVHTEYMALITLVTLAITLGVILVIIKNYREELSVKGPAKKPVAPSGNRFSDLFKNKFTLYLFILALLPVFGLYFVDFVFFGQTQLAFPQKEVLSGFIGIFFGVMALVEFLIKTLVYGRLVEKFGIKPGLIALPVLLLFSTVLASFSGTFFGVASMFSFVVLSKLFIRSIRNSINDPSCLILYQALPAHERFAFQGKVEAGPKAISNIVVGAILILLLKLGVNLVVFNYVFILILVFWTWSSFRIYDLYRDELKKIVNSKPDQPEPVPVLAEMGVPTMRDLDKLLKKKDGNPEMLQNILSILGTIGEKESIVRLRSYLNYPVYTVRKEALLALCKNRYSAIPSEIPLIKRSIEDEIYFIVWHMGCISDLQNHAHTTDLINELQQEIDEKRLFIFNLLSLLFDPSVMNHIREHLRQGTPEAKIYAVELFDMMVSRDIKGLILPMLEDLPIDQVLASYQETFPQENLTLSDRIIDIIHKDYSHVGWKTKAEAIKLLALSPSEKARRVLYACLSHPDERIWQPACEVLLKTDPERVSNDIRLFGKNREKFLLEYNVIK